MRRKILIVDDQYINRKILYKILSVKYDILEAEDGLQALEVLKENMLASKEADALRHANDIISPEGDTDHREISLVVLDLIMPNLDGYGVLAEMQKDATLSSIPVMVASQAEKSEEEEHALRLGARDFLMKPYKPGILLQRIANLIQLNESSQRIEHIERDELTGLFRKEAFCDRISSILAEHPDTKYLVVAADVERFKLVNDIFGMEEGDKLLVYLAKLLKKGVHHVGGICARSTADHFLAFLPYDNSGERLKGIVEKTQHVISSYPLNMKLTMKIGIYNVEDRTLSPNSMCDRAELATNSIKGQYDKVYAFYDDSFRQKLLDEQVITNEMKTALTEGQFQVYFQPKYDLVSETIAGAEALVRWIHPTLGFMNPGEFIPLFERNGFISELDKFVWEKTCETIASWIRLGNKYVPVSVNVSRKDIYHENLPKHFSELVAKYGLEPKHLHLEITESAYTEDAEQIIHVVTELKNLGFAIEMDDFGSGYSSLNMLSEMPIDILKLDMRFIQKQTDKNESRNILSFIISLAKWMKLGVIAEGVETETQVEILRNMDCNYVQGYYYAKPMPEPEFTKLLLDSVVDLSNEAVGEITTNGPVITQNLSNNRLMLIVDDVAMNRVILAECFRDLYTIVELENGKDAYEFIREHFDEIDIIMLDLLMPVMDGFELLKKLQVNSLYSDIPVIVTSQAGEESEAEAFALGANDFLSKPYFPSIAIHRVQNVTARMKVRSLERDKEILKKMRKLSLEAKLDSFTGVYNRIELENQVKLYYQNENPTMGIFIMMDIDDFKVINDTFGHDVGDTTLQRVANILLQEFRNDDVIARMGGDEFAIFIQADIGKEELIQRLKSLSRKLTFQVENYTVTCSIGIALAPAHGEDYQTLYHNADVALLTAKRLGKNQFYIFSGNDEIPNHILYRNMDWLLDESSDAILISDAETNELYYLNDMATKLADKTKSECIGLPCYQAIWNLNKPCSHCIHIDKMTREYCEHIVHPLGTDRCYLIKGKIIDWGNRQARIQYIQDFTNHQ